jgi:hypothetical protein
VTFNPLQHLRATRDVITASKLFDAALYSQTYLRHNALRWWPLAHYFLFGERAGFRPNPWFDPKHYRRQLAAAGVRPCWPVLAQYAKAGAGKSITPSSEFNPAWYMWQNPDWNDGGVYAEPLAHFLGVGLPQRRDPSPFVDLRRHLAGLGSEAAATPAITIVNEIHRHGRLEGPGITTDFSQLRARQAAFRAGLNYDVIRRGRPTRQNLVFLQSGVCARPPYLVHNRRFDLLRNYYADPGANVCDESDHVLFQRGTKVTGIEAILRRDPELLLAYDHVLFLDDDITMSAGEIEHFFAVMQQHSLVLAQPLLSADSDCTWPVFNDTGNTGRIIPVSSVEVMMPGFSRDALCHLAWTFGKTVSGFGVDLLWGQALAADRDAGRIAVIGDVLARHERPIDEAGGAFYNYMADNDINPKLELWMVLSEHGVAPEFCALEPNSRFEAALLTAD